MPLPENWHYRMSGPQKITCDCDGPAGNLLIPTEDWSYRITGVVSQLYVCLRCHCGWIIRYAPDSPNHYLRTERLGAGKVSLRRYLISAGVLPSALRAAVEARGAK